MQKHASRPHEPEPIPRHTVYLGIGSNIGNRLAHLQEAVGLLNRMAETAVTGVSEIYMTEPVGVTEQDRFYNGVVRLETALSPENLRSHCKAIEHNLGRPEQYIRWSPRVIDLDILLYGDLTMHSSVLSIPHPELTNRMFVLIPLLDLDDPPHPVLHCPVSSLLVTCPDRSVLVRLREGVALP
ncbi:2-amino-4-hydroxy-6-hydroxymethyldihydropteridine diphosphokinase [Chlorobium sp.]|jgi:2-amino-4-hydroxy-6-hydroxymethyldihydropteridine diphosphokinase|uniref:2-amino-4-hydroxy-6- hydroxymethyldihydropteridine diphosphokinase n=1 Tax=Chlorobium sp. TaxID=1095 RepID=UPI003C7046B9